VVQTLATVVIASPLALGYGPVIAFELRATNLTAVMLCIYIVINISTIGYKETRTWGWSARRRQAAA
jgi:hypothetical protein